MKILLEVIEGESKSTAEFIIGGDPWSSCILRSYIANDIAQRMMNDDSVWIRQWTNKDSMLQKESNGQDKD
jgi:hypothetical protein